MNTLKRLFTFLTKTWVLSLIISLAVFLYLYLSTSSRRMPSQYPMGDLSFELKPVAAVEEVKLTPQSRIRRWNRQMEERDG